VNTNRRTRITIESERVLVVAGKQTIRRWCETCGCEVDVRDQEQAGPDLDVLSREGSETCSGGPHLHPSKSGLAMGLKSILQFLKAAGTRHGSQ
jgi:hypothetical protein